ncbi:MAG: hypothetical protein ACLPKB_13265 [Xanthobacteraceae bacterium]|jgi:hypothetical protein
MKKLMLALAAVVCLSAPALAQYNNGYGGYNNGYSSYNSYTRGGYGGYRDRSYDRARDDYRGYRAPRYNSYGSYNYNRY